MTTIVPASYVDYYVRCSISPYDMVRIVVANAAALEAILKQHVYDILIAASVGTSCMTFVFGPFQYQF